MRVNPKLSGIVGVVDWKSIARNSVLCVSAVLLVSASPGLASAQPEIPDPPIPTFIEVPQGPSNTEPQYDAPSAPLPQEAPAPPPPTVAPAPPPTVAPPVIQAPPPVVSVPDTDEPPATQAPAPSPVAPPPPVAPAPQIVAPEPTAQAPAPTTQVEEAPPVTRTEAPRSTQVDDAPVPPPPPRVEELPEAEPPTLVPVVPDQSTSVPQPGSEEPRQPEATQPEQPSSQQSSASESSAPEPSEAATPTTVGESANEAAKEPVLLPEPQAVKVNEALTVPEAELKPLAPVEPVSVSEADQKLVDDALRTVMTTPTTTATPTPTTTTNKPWPGGHDKPWECKDKRGDHGCNWDRWDHDRDGRPRFTNPYRDLWQLIQWLDHRNQRQQVWVPPHSQLPINLGQTGFYAFAILTVDHRGVSLSASFGMFSGNAGVQCFRHPCHVPHRPVFNASFMVYIPFGNGYRYVPRRVYDCGCQPVYRRDNRQYYRYYFEGYREVIAYREERVVEGRRQQVIVPVEYRENPVRPVYTPVTADNVGEVVGLEPPGGSPDQNPTNQAAAQAGLEDNRVLYIVAIVIGGVLTAGLVASGVYRRRRDSSS